MNKKRRMISGVLKAEPENCSMNKKRRMISGVLKAEPEK